MVVPLSSFLNATGLSTLNADPSVESEEINTGSIVSGMGAVSHVAASADVLLVHPVSNIADASYFGHGLVDAAALHDPSVQDKLVLQLNKEMTAGGALTGAVEHARVNGELAIASMMGKRGDALMEVLFCLNQT